MGPGDRSKVKETHFDGDSSGIQPLLPQTPAYFFTHLRQLLAKEGYAFLIFGEGDLMANGLGVSFWDNGAVIQSTGQMVDL